MKIFENANNLTVDEVHNKLVEVFSKIDYKQPDLELTREISNDAEKGLRVLEEEVKALTEKPAESSDEKTNFRKEVGFGLTSFFSALLIVFVGVTVGLHFRDYFFGIGLGTIILAAMTSFTFYMLHTHYYEKRKLARKEIEIRESAINDIHRKRLLLFFATTLGSALHDLVVYEDIYKTVLQVQEYLMKNDEKGFESFNNAFKTLNLDLSKYEKEINNE